MIGELGAAGIISGSMTTGITRDKRANSIIKISGSPAHARTQEAAHEPLRNKRNRKTLKKISHEVPSSSSLSSASLMTSDTGLLLSLSSAVSASDVPGGEDASPNKATPTLLTDSFLLLAMRDETRNALSSNRVALLRVTRV